MKESFFEINSKSRRKIYIYLWSTDFLLPICVLEPWLEGSGGINKFSLIISICIILYCYIFEAILLLNLSLRKEKVRDIFLEHIFIFRLQLFLYIYIYVGMESFFQVVINQSLNSSLQILLILITIITLWVLKDILILRQHALKKMN